MNKSIMRVFVLVILSIFIFQSSPTNANLLFDTLVQEESTAIFQKIDYEIENEIWKQVSLMPEPLGYFGMSQVNGNIYTFGGTNWARYPLTSNIVQKFDPIANTWQKLSAFPEPVQQKAISLGEKIYIFGGDKIDASFNHVPLSSTWEYDTSTNLWVQKADLPAPRMMNGVAIQNGKFYIIGGSTSESDNYKDTIFVYDPILDSWSEGAPMPSARMHLLATAVNGKIYTFGGWAAGGLSVVEVYDPSTNSWSAKSNMPIPRWADGNEIIENNGKIYFVGGCTGDYTCTMLSRVDVYDVETDTWSSLPDLPIAYTGGGTTIVDGILYSIGGYNYGTFYDTVFAYALGTNSPSWLLMYYIASDSDMDTETAFTNEFKDIQKATKQDNINRVIFWDSLIHDASYYAIPSEGEEIEIKKGILNSGNGESLSDFISWAKTNYPAEHYALIINDHGNGLSGVAKDLDADKDDYITPNELKQALLLAGPIDILYMNACLMGSLEIEYQLRGLVDYYVAHESIGWGPVPHSDYIARILAETTPRELSIQMAESYFLNTRSPSTVSVVDMAFVETVAQKASALASGVRSNWNLIGGQFWEILTSGNLQRFDENLNGIDTSDKLADLYHLAELTKVIPQLEDQSLDLLSTKNDYVIFNRAWGGIFQNGGVEYYYNHHYGFGVTVALPTTPTSFYFITWLDFAEGADWSGLAINNIVNENGLEWGAMVSDLVLEFNPFASDQPEPPPLVAPLINYSIYLPLIKNGSLCSNAPTLLEPSNGANLDNLIPLFKWDNGNDPNATELHLEIAGDPGFAQIIWTLWGGGLGGIHEFRFSQNFDPSTTLYWRAYLMCGMTQSPHSEAWSFTTGSSGTLLPAPTLLAPTDETMLPSLPVDLEWSAIDSAVEYLVHWTLAGSVGYTYSMTTDTNFIIGWGLTPNTTYDWWITARNDYAWGNDSVKWKFTTPAESLSIPTKNITPSYFVEQDGSIHLSSD